MKSIELTQNQVTWVDDWNYGWLSQWKWYAKWDKGTHGYYACRNISLEVGKRTTLRMHSQIMKTPKGMKTDHINGDTLFNLEKNLRVCTQAENAKNRGKSTNNSSGYKGVSWHKRAGKFQSQIQSDGKTICLGYFITPEEAAMAYDRAAARLHKEFAGLNF